LKSVYYFTNIFPKYRESIWKLLIEESRYDFNIFFSSQEFNGIKSSTSFKNKKLHGVKNYILKSRLIWQTNVIKTVCKKKIDVVIFMGEMNVISTWLAIIICKLRNIQIWFWGHGIYGNESKLKKFFRLFFLKLADKHLLYEKRAKQILIENGFKKENLEIIYNSLDYELQKKLFKELETEKPASIPYFKNDYPTLLFVGRLTRQKKLEILIRAVKELDKLDYKVNLLIIGDGDQKDHLTRLINKLRLNNFYFYGSLYDENKISSLIYNSDLCVSPGNVGLTAIHSLSYGTSIASHNNFSNQMPEVDSIIEGVNGFLFRDGDYLDLALKIKSFLEVKPGKKKIRQIIDDKYNPYFQKRIFDQLILNG
jgi:glycosyltransferase involved in cell wall biosynthesis